LWDVIEKLVSDGTTVLLTTQYLEEADRLADSISVIDNGTVIAKGTADELKSSVGGQRVALTVVDETDGDAVRTLLASHGTGEPVVTGGRTWVVPVDNGPAALAAIMSAAARDGIALHDAGMRRPTLDDVFLQLTGHVADDSDETTESAA
jgi:ABC-2 type transport system ATP-binding protein